MLLSKPTWASNKVDGMTWNHWDMYLCIFYGGRSHGRYELNEQVVYIIHIVCRQRMDRYVIIDIFG